MRSSYIRCAGLLAATAAATVAVAAPADAAATGRKTVTVGVTKSHAVTMTGSLRPGLVRLHNTSTQELVIYGRRHSGVDRLVKDENASRHSDRPGNLLKDFAVVGMLVPRSYAYVPLPAGTYYLLDDEVEKVQASKVHTLTVRGAKVDAKAPAKAAPVVVKRDGSLYAARSLPRNGYVHFVNHAKTVHETIIVGVGRSVSDTTVRDFLAKPSFDKMFDDLRPRTIDLAGLGAAARSEYLPFRNAAGRYVLADLSFTPTSTKVSLHKSGVRLATVK